MTHLYWPSHLIRHSLSAGYLATSRNDPVIFVLYEGIYRNKLINSIPGGTLFDHRETDLDRMGLSRLSDNTFSIAISMTLVSEIVAET